MDSIPSWLKILLLLFFVLAHAFYSAAETAYACLNKYKYKAKAEAGSKTAALIVRLYDHFETTLITILIGNNLVAILVSTLSTFLFLEWFGGIIPDATVSLIASIAMSVVVFLFGDSIPKFLGKKASDAVAVSTAYPMAFFVVIFYPVSAFFRFLSFLLKKIFRAKEEPELTEEDFSGAIEEAEELGAFEENESDIIQATFEFADTSVKEVLTPLRKMAMLDISGLTQRALLDYIVDCPYSRIPLYFKSKDKIIGILVVKNYLNAFMTDKTVNYLNYAQKPYFVSPSVKIDDLIESFRKKHTQIAIVRKEGHVLGMVTMEDVLEELVGGIAEKNALKGAAK